jgi:hypothetical protein
MAQTFAGAYGIMAAESSRAARAQDEATHFRRDLPHRAPSPRGLVLPAAEWIAATNRQETQFRTLASLVFLQTLIMQFLGDYWW